MEEHFPLRARQQVMAAELQTVATLNQGCVSHQVARISMFVRGCVIDVLTVPNADQVGYFRKKERTAVDAIDGAWRLCSEDRRDLVARHRLEAFMNVIANPRNAGRPVQRHLR